jgi:predicted  nucleic acid-binding Zn-ribbon protein
MPPMEREKHEDLLNELLTPELETSRKTEILQELRKDYGTVHSDFSDLTKNNASLQKKHDDLVVSNSMLFRQIGNSENPEKSKEEEQKSFSESVTIESLEGGE